MVEAGRSKQLTIIWHIAEKNDSIVWRGSRRNSSQKEVTETPPLIWYKYNFIYKYKYKYKHKYKYTQEIQNTNTNTLCIFVFVFAIVFPTTLSSSSCWRPLERETNFFNKWPKCYIALNLWFWMLTTFFLPIILFN